MTHSGSSKHMKRISFSSTSLFKSNSVPVSHVSLYNYENTPVDICYCRSDSLQSTPESQLNAILSGCGHIHAMHRLSLNRGLFCFSLFTTIIDFEFYYSPLSHKPCHNVNDDRLKLNLPYIMIEGEFSATQRILVVNSLNRFLHLICVYISYCT